MRGFDPNEFTCEAAFMRGEARVELWIQDKPEDYVVAKIRVPALVNTDIMWLACNSREHMFSMLEWQAVRLAEDGWKKA
jgi:hypothetical protein